MKKKYQTPCKTLRDHLRRDRFEKMKSLYGRPMDLSKEDDPLKPARGIVQSLVFSALLVGICTIIYFIVKS